MYSISRKLRPVFYYLRNGALDLIPQHFFQRKLARSLAVIGDNGGLHERLNYYNRLIEPFSAEGSSMRVDSVPRGKSRYYYDLRESARYFPPHFAFDAEFGDVTHIPARPSFVKSRPIAADNGNSVLMKLNKLRHFYFPEDRIPFESKKPVAVWRGAINNPKRRVLLQRHFDSSVCDIGHTGGFGDEHYRKDFAGPQKQIEFKYIISVEGKDVATNLKWIFSSNSLCLMPKPQYESWFMEGKLEDGRHYVQLRDDFEDLEEKVAYFERHPDEALTIIANAQDFARQFQDRAAENSLSLMVMYKYFCLSGQMDIDEKIPLTCEHPTALYKSV